MGPRDTLLNNSLTLIVCKIKPLRPSVLLGPPNAVIRTKAGVQGLSAQWLWCVGTAPQEAEAAGMPCVKALALNL